MARQLDERNRTAPRRARGTGPALHPAPNQASNPTPNQVSNQEPNPQANQQTNQQPNQQAKSGPEPTGPTGPNQAAKPAPGPARPESADLSVERVTRFADLRALEPEWRTLADEAAPRNPYASPDWTLTWLEHAVDERELAVVTVRRSGQLIGLAPFYLRQLGHLAHTAQLAGTARLGSLTELPQVLAAPGAARGVLRCVVGDWLDRAGAWDWLELPLSADQGWFEPQWLGESREVRGSVQHKTTRAAVIMPLPDTVEELRGALRRNVWKSVKRGRHRLERLGRPWEITVHTGETGLRAALPTLRRLHTARAAMAGARTHPDALADPQRAAFLDRAVARMAAHDRAELWTLTVDGEAVAAQLVLRAAEAGYFSLSGVDPQWWSEGPVTVLQHAAMERAIERGDAEMNLSIGPDISKLRWSEQVVQHPEFVVCGPRTRSRTLLSGYAAAAAVAAVHREAGRHRVRKRGATGPAKRRSGGRG